MECNKDSMSFVSTQPTSPHPAPNPALQSEGYNYLFHPRQFRHSTRSAGMRFRSGVPRHSSILDAEEALYTADAEAKHKELLEVLVAASDLSETD